MIECPKHEGNFDCTPFCEVCGGEQEITCPHTSLSGHFTGEAPYCLDCGLDLEHKRRSK